MSNTMAVGGPSPFPVPTDEGATLIVNESGLTLLVSMRDWMDSELTAISAQTAGRVHALTRNRLLVMAWEFGKNLSFDSWTDVGPESEQIKGAISGWIGAPGLLTVTIVAVERSNNDVARLRLASLPASVSNLVRFALKTQLAEPTTVDAYSRAVNSGMAAFPSTDKIIARAVASGKLGQQ